MLKSSVFMGKSQFVMFKSVFCRVKLAKSQFFMLKSSFFMAKCQLFMVQSKRHEHTPSPLPKFVSAVFVSPSSCPAWGYFSREQQQRSIIENSEGKKVWKPFSLFPAEFSSQASELRTNVHGQSCHRIE